MVELEIMSHSEFPVTTTQFFLPPRSWFYEQNTHDAFGAAAQLDKF